MKIPVFQGPGQPRPRNTPVAQAGNGDGLQSVQVQDLWAQGLTGKGIGVAILDSGCAPHSDLGDRLVSFYDPVEKRSDPYDCDIHGTAVATLLAGSGQGLQGQLHGVAPEAHLLVARVEDQDHCVDSRQVLQALEWVSSQRQRYNIQVVNLSFGLADTGMMKVADKVKELREQGVLVLTSAGNEGPTPKLFNVFKASPDLLTVANADTRGTLDTSDDRIGEHSSRARETSKKTPDFAAPGFDLVAGAPEGGYMRFGDGGTSFATALASGVMALWKQAVPDLTLEEARQALQHTSLPMQGESPSSQGAGLIQARAGLDYLRNLRAT